MTTFSDMCHSLFYVRYKQKWCMWISGVKETWHGSLEVCESKNGSLVAARTAEDNAAIRGEDKYYYTL